MLRVIRGLHERGNSAGVSPLETFPVFNSMFTEVSEDFSILSSSYIRGQRASVVSGQRQELEIR